MRSTSEAAPDVVADLEAAAAEREAAEAAVAEVGESDVRRVAAAVDDATALLAKYRDSATGTGDFKAYVQFQEAVAELVEDLDDDLPRYEAFEDYESAVDDRRLSEADFEAAREALAPAEAVANRLEERQEARERYRQARRDVRRRRDEVEDRIAELRRVAELGDADLDAPVAELRTPVEAYNDAVTDAFQEFKREAPAREVLALVTDASERALVDLEAPDDELRAFVRSSAVGEESVTTLLEYADYSRSKLDHYVDDADELKRVVATRHTALSRLSAEPLTVDWPPPDAATLRRRAKAYESVVRGFAGEGVVARCREVRRLAHRDDYARLREAAVARDELTEDQRGRLAEGAVEAEIAERERERDRLEAALDEHPAP